VAVLSLTVVVPYSAQALMAVVSVPAMLVCMALTPFATLLLPVLLLKSASTPRSGTRSRPRIIVSLARACGAIRGTFVPGYRPYAAR
jgi:hypothetical protein